MSASSSTLVVIVPGWRSKPGSMQGIQELAAAVLVGDITFCAPRLGFENPLSSTRATTLVQRVLKAIDDEVAVRQFDRIVLVGHSVGATILRRVFLVAAGRPYNFTYEDALTSEPPRAWAQIVERIVLIASFNRGWSVSERTSWYYSFGFNVAGLLGHLSPRKDWTPGIFDFRLGAPFMVQTRLHWMAHRRLLANERVAPPPIVIQVIGTQDDLISPFDQVDISVDGTGRALVATATSDKHQIAPVPPAARDYFLLEMPDSDHESAVVLTDMSGQPCQQRRDILRLALTGTRNDLDGAALDPALLADQVPLVDETVKNTVFVIHGIRDDGFWTHRIAERVRQAAGAQSPCAFRSWTPTYGYFAMLPFILPWVRRQKVEWFMDQYVSAFSQYPKSDFHYVGHSNGTYLAAGGFKDYPAFHLQHVLFAGSVVRSDFNWANIAAAGRVTAVQNLVASADWVVACFPKGLRWWKIFDLGGAGVDGFDAAKAGTPGVHDLTYVRGAHGAGIVEGHWKQIGEFIVSGTPIVSDGSGLFANKPNRFIKIIGQTSLVLPLLLALVVCLGWWIAGDWSGWNVAFVAVYAAILRFIVVRF